MLRLTTTETRTWECDVSRIRCDTCDGLGSIEFPAIHSFSPAMVVCCPGPQVMVEGFGRCGGKGYLPKERNK